MSVADVLIVGCGMQGATLALAAARRGLRPLVIERRQPAAGATGSSYGIIHGGLRYLQTLDVGRWRKSRRDQAWFVETFPDLVRPLPCLMPLYRGRFRSPATFAAAFLLERLLMRMTGQRPVLPPGRLVGAQDVASRYPIPVNGLTGAALWHDAALSDTAAVVAAILDEAGGRDSVLRSGVDIEGPLVEKGCLVGLRGVDAQSGRDVTFTAPVTVLCAGSGSRRLAARLDRDQARLSTAVLAFNLLLDVKVDLPSAVAVSPDPGRGRSYFLRSQDGGLFAGTYYVPCPGADEPEVSAPLIAEFLSELDRCVPALKLRDAAVRTVTAGLLPDTDGTGRTLRSDDFFWDHAATGGPRGLYTVLGTKLTTAPALSEYAARRIWPAMTRTTGSGVFETRGRFDVGADRKGAVHGS